MSRVRLLANPGAIRPGARVEITGAEAAHATRVLRLKLGQDLELMDGQGVVGEAVVEELGRGRVVCRVGRVWRPELPMPRVVVCLGLLKSKAMDLAVAKLAELGASELRPVLFTRCVARPRPGQVERWRRVGLQVIKQCALASPPQIYPPEGLEEVLGAMPGSARGVILWEGGEGESLSEALGEGPAEIWVVVGPEGGLTPQELELARDRGLKPVSLGPWVLRAETAAIAVVSAIRFGLMPWQAHALGQQQTGEPGA